MGGVCGVGFPAFVAACYWRFDVGCFADVVWFGLPLCFVSLCCIVPSGFVCEWFWVGGFTVCVCVRIVVRRWWFCGFGGCLVLAVVLWCSMLLYFFCGFWLYCVCVLPDLVVLG